MIDLNEDKILILKDVFKSFNGTRVINGLNLEIKTGEIMCLLGPSGCGKTTALRLIAGLENPEEGSIHIDRELVCNGKNIKKQTQDRDVGIVFQDFSLFPHLNVFENVSFGIKGSLTRDKTRERTDHLLKCVEMSPFQSKYPHMLSGGEQQRVALARALAPKPKLMLMDEPFSSLDNRLRDDIRDLTLGVLRNENSSVIMVTHDPEEAMKISDSIAVMRSGKIVQKGAPYNVYNKPLDSECAKFLSKCNVIMGEVLNSQTTTPFGLFMTPGVRDGLKVEIIIRPQHLKIDFDRNGKGPSPTAERGIAAKGKVYRARFLGKESLIELKMEFDQSILRATVPGVFLPPKDTKLWVSVKRDRCFVFVKE